MTPPRRGAYAWFAVEEKWEDDTAVTAVAESSTATEKPKRDRPCLIIMSGGAVGSMIRVGDGETVIGRGAASTIRIEDDGHGFPFKGRLLGAELAALQMGPRSLRERAEMLGGTLAVASGDTGATVEISIPVTRESICA